MSTITHGTPSFHIYCAHHNCELFENEHYDNWFLMGDLSGFNCPGVPNDDDGTENDKCEWKISPVGHDEINILSL